VIGVKRGHCCQLISFLWKLQAETDRARELGIMLFQIEGGTDSLVSERAICVAAQTSC